MKPSRAVLDTSVLYAALYSETGASRYLLDNAAQLPLVLVASAPLFLEYEAVLTRPESLAAFGRSRANVEAILDALAGLAEPVAVHYHWRPNLPDEADNLLVECAVAGNCDFLATLNVRDFQRGELGPFQFQVVTPGELVRSLRQKGGH